MIDKGKEARVFVSHSSIDKPFVRRLVADLTSHNKYVWFDEQELKPGDSIVNGISEGLTNTDYFVVVLSNVSVQSQWVKAELNAALMNQFSDQGTVVLPVLVEDCTIPPLLRDRVYADFRGDYDAGLKSLLRVLEQETYSADDLAMPRRKHMKRMFPPSCSEVLAEFRLADLRRRITNRMDRAELATLWFDTLESRMDDDMANRTKVECVIELLERARNRHQLDYLIHNLCAERPDLAYT